MKNCTSSFTSETVKQPTLSSNQKSFDRLSRSLTIETSPRSLASGSDTGARILHPDGTETTVDRIPDGSIKLFRYMSGM